jgi:cysteine desulfurase
MIPIVLVAFKNIDAETLQMVLSNKGIYVSTLSACSSGKKDDRILEKLHLPNDFKNGTIRISWDVTIKKEAIENDIREIATSVKHMQSLKDVR